MSRSNSPEGRDLSRQRRELYRQNSTSDFLVNGLILPTSGSRSSEKEASGTPDDVADLSPCEKSITLPAFPTSHRGSQVSRRASSLTPAQIYHLSSSYSTAFTSSPRASSGATSDLEGKTEHPDFELLRDPYFSPVPTTQCFQQFKRVVARKVDPRIEKVKKIKLHILQKEKLKHESTLNLLRDWVASKKAAKTLRGALKQIFTLKGPVHLPLHDDMIQLARYHYPLRCELMVYVCDFGEGRFEKKEVKFCDIDTGKSPSAIARLG